MKPLTYPVFLDIEASGLVVESYPIEIAWNDAAGDIKSFLIKPDPEWSYWNEDAQALHRISRTTLKHEGISLHEACDLLDADLKGGHIFSDASFYERQWLDRLYDTASRKRPFTVQCISKIQQFRKAFVVRAKETDFNRFQEKAFEELGDRHRAAIDVKAMMMVYEMCAEL